MSEFTYRIPIKEAFRLFGENKELQAVTETGNFQCIAEYDEDGKMGKHCYFVINHEKFIEHREDEKTYLTDYAKKNLSECALRFTIQQKQSTATS